MLKTYLIPVWKKKPLCDSCRYDGEREPDGALGKPKTIRRMLKTSGVFLTTACHGRYTRRFFNCFIKRNWGRKKWLRPCLQVLRIILHCPSASVEKYMFLTDWICHLFHGSNLSWMEAHAQNFMYVITMFNFVVKYMTVLEVMLYSYDGLMI